MRFRRGAGTKGQEQAREIDRFPAQQPVVKYEAPKYRSFADYITRTAYLELQDGIKALKQIPTTTSAEINALIDYYNSIVAEARELDALEAQIELGSAGALRNEIDDRYSFEEFPYGSGRFEIRVNSYLSADRRQFPGQYEHQKMRGWTADLPDAERRMMVDLIDRRWDQRQQLHRESLAFREMVKGLEKTLEMSKATEAVQMMQLEPREALDKEEEAARRLAARQALEAQAEGIREAYEAISAAAADPHLLPLDAVGDAAALPARGDGTTHEIG